MTWLKNDLKYVPEEHLIVLMMHIPIHTDYSTSDNMILVNRDKLFEIIQSRKHLLALSGHLHVIENLKLGPNCGWNNATPFYSMNLGAGCGAWWSGPKDERGVPLSYCMDGSPNGYFVFSFEGNTFNQNFYPASQSADFQIRVSCPDKAILADSLSIRPIVVNIFNADSETEVYFQIDDSNRSLMMRQRMRDPFMVDYFTKNRKDFPWWVNDVEVTDHIWTANLPANLNTGQHTIKISAIDGFNNIYSQVKIFEVKK